jgi:undecaprenyl-diphosphatase
VTYLDVLILGIIEGLTEFLPVSSTGHLILASTLLGIEQTNFTKSFEIFIQLGAISAVSFLYFKRLISNQKLWLYTLIGFVPTALIGLILYGFVKSYLLGNVSITLLSLLVGGIIITLVDKRLPDTDHQLDTKKALLIGLFQATSIVPGVSRAAATIIGGRLLGLDRKTSVEFSFFLAIPTIFGATFLDLLKSDINFSSLEIKLLAFGFIVSFISALMVIKWLLKFVLNNSFKIFGIYRIIIAVLIWLVLK